MMNDPVYTHFLELSWRRKLTSAEEIELRAWLESHPGAQAAWEAETALSDALGLLPETPVPSNFTARVMHGVERDKSAASRRATRQRAKWWRRFIPKVALAALLAAAGIFSYAQFHAAQVRAEAD